MPKAKCVKVPKKLGEKAINLVKAMHLCNHKLQIQQIEKYLLIPLAEEIPTDVLNKFNEKLPNFEISVHNFNLRETKHFSYIDFLVEKLSPALLQSVPRTIDFVGDIAIIELPPQLHDHKKDIGEALLKANKQTKTVLAKSGAVEGVYRIRDFEVIAGAKRTTTICREYGCKYHIDVAKAYFSPRLSSEHNRVASAVKDEETVVDLFAGVGPFAIPIAKKNKNVRVYAIDLNPEAVALLKKNVALNRTETQISPILGDARRIVRKNLSGKADRVIMNLPEIADEFVDVACEAIKPEGGIIHYYCFVNAPDPIEEAQVRLTEAVKQNNRRVAKIILVKKVREVAPYAWQMVVDARIQ